MKKYRCPGCGNSFVGQLSVCPHCGKHLRFSNTPVSPSEPTKPVSLPSEPTSPTAFNFLHLLITLMGLGFSVMTVFLPIYVSVVHTSAGDELIEFNIYSRILAFIDAAPAGFATFSFESFASSANFLFKDLLPLFLAAFSAINAFALLIMVFRALFILCTKKAPAELRGPGMMGRAGQFPSAFIEVGLAYLSAFLPYWFGLWILRLGTADSGFVDFLRMFVDNTAFHGLSYWHYFYLGYLVLMFILSLFRLGSKAKYRKNAAKPRHLKI